MTMRFVMVSCAVLGAILLLNTILIPLNPSHVPTDNNNGSGIVDSPEEDNIIPSYGDINNNTSATNIPVYNAKVLDNIKLNVSLPNMSMNVCTFNLSIPIYNLSYCTNLINRTFPEWLDNNTTNIKMNDNSSRFLKGTESITIIKSGALMYSNISAQQKWEQFLPNMFNKSKNQTDIISSCDAYNKSEEFIISHGGFPQDWYRSYNNTVILVYNNISIVNSYEFTITRKLYDYPIIGNGGEGARVILTPLGDIRSYVVLWREINTIEKNVTTVPASLAIYYVNTNTRSNVTQEKTIYKIELGYYSNEFRQVQQILKPVWIFYTNPKCTQFLFIDAVELKFGG